MNGLTIDALIEACERVRELMPLYCYAETDEIPPGQVLYLKETDYTHQAILFHTGEFETFRAQVPEIRWVHLRDAPIKLPPLRPLIEEPPFPPLLWRPK